MTDYIEETSCCIECKSEIERGAKICIHCKSAQSWWKNELNFWSPKIALISAIFVAGFWLWDNRTIWPWFYTEDVRLVAGSTEGAVVVANRGSGDVFISDLVLTMPGRETWILPRLFVQEKLAPREFLKRDFNDHNGDNGVLIRELSEEKFKALVDKAVAGDPCYKMVFYIDGDSRLQQVIEMTGGGVNRFKVGGYLDYISMRDNLKKRIPVTGSGTVMRAFECAPSDK